MCVLTRTATILKLQRLKDIIRMISELETSIVYGVGYIQVYKMNKLLDRLFVSTFCQISSIDRLMRLVC